MAESIRRASSPRRSSSPTSTCCACRKSRTTSRIRASREAPARTSSPRSLRCCPDSRRVGGVAVDHPAEGGRRRRFGNMILSRLPVRQAYRHLLPSPIDPGQERNAAHRGGGVRRRAVRRCARDHHASRVLLRQAARGADRGAALDPRRRSRLTRARARSSIPRAGRSTRTCARRRPS